MNDWDRIREVLFADRARSRGTLEQAWRWTADARAWLDRHGIDVRAVAKGDIERYLAESPDSGVADRNKRVWAFRRLIAAASTFGARRARSPGSAAARLDSVCPGSAARPVGRLISRRDVRARRARCADGSTSSARHRRGEFSPGGGGRLGRVCTSLRPATTTRPLRTDS